MDDLQLGESIAIFMCSNAQLAHLLSRLLPLRGISWCTLAMRTVVVTRDLPHTHTHTLSPNDKVLATCDGAKFGAAGQAEHALGPFHVSSACGQTNNTHTHTLTHTHTYLCMSDKHAINKLHDYTKFQSFWGLLLFVLDGGN